MAKRAKGQDPALLRRLLRAKDRMDAASHEEWPIARLAGISGVSEAHFARSFKDAFDAAFADICGGVDVYYAGKSFLCTEIARWVDSEGLRLDTCSGGELAVASQPGDGVLTAPSSPRG